MLGAPPHAEAASQISAPEWDVLSGRGFKRKLYPRFDAQNGIRFPVEASNGKCVPEFGSRVGCVFRLELQTESASRNPRLEWDTLSGTALNRKLRPRISLQSGMPFPAEPSGGKCIPELTLGVGHGFRMESQRKLHPVLSVQAGTRFPLEWLLGKRGPDRGDATRQCVAQQPLQLYLVEPCRQRGLPDTCRLQLFGEHSCRADLVHGKAQQGVTVER